ncbi:MAG: CBS domain-containing protein [Gammaproteobacteria bacterium]
MTVDRKTIHSGMLAVEALQIMDNTRIDVLPIVNAANELVGALNMHDLLRAGVV